MNYINAVGGSIPHANFVTLKLERSLTSGLWRHIFFLSVAYLKSPYRIALKLQNDAFLRRFALSSALKSLAFTNRIAAADIKSEKLGIGAVEGACKEKVGKLYLMGSRGKVAAKAGGSSQEAKCSRLAKKQDMASVMVKAKYASVPLQKKKMRNPTRRSLRIKNSVDTAENLSNEPQVCVLIDSDSETEVEFGARNKSAEPVIETPGLENGDGRKKKGGRPRKVKKTQESVNEPRGMNPDVAAGRTQEDQRIYNAVKTQDVVNEPREMNDGLAAGRAEEEQRVKNAENTQEVVNKHRGLNDGLVAGTEEEQHVDNAEQTQEAATEPVEGPSSQNIRDRESRYKTLYIKAMRRLDAVTEERNVLSRQLAVAQVKIGVLHDFRDQLSEVTEKLDVANERLEVYQKTMNPQMVDILRDFLTATNQSQTTEVPMNTSSEKDTGTDRATKPPIRSSKRHKHK